MSVEVKAVATVPELVTADGRRPRVAIVGGTPSGGMVATVLCDQFGCVPLNARTGEAILALLRRDIPIDLVIVDLSVPDMDGIVAVQLIRALGARGGLPIVALAENRTEVTTNRARSAEFAACVVKPYSPRELHAALSHALAARQRRAETETA